MKGKQHKLTAISLAFLILISTTGISMNMMLCNCTGQQYLAFLAKQTNLTCCQQKANISPKQVCCSSSSIIPKHHHAQTSTGEPTILVNKNCCSSFFQYTKANINLDLIQVLELPAFVGSLLTNLIKISAAYIAPVVIPQHLVVQEHSNKAPPRFGRSILNWFQIYRC